MDFTQAVAASVLSSPGDAVIATDTNGIIRLWNRGAERVFGYRVEEALGQTLDIIIPERLRNRHWAGFRRVMATGQSRYGGGDLLSVPSIRKDGQPISIEFTIIPLKDESGGAIGMAAVMRDVTERFQETKRLREKLTRQADGT